MKNFYQFENKLINQGYRYICGTDEAGRGPMAGPLVAAAVILPYNYHISGLNDSKKLSEKKRKQLYHEILEHAIEVSISMIDVETVDKINVYEASKLAMINCIKKMKTKIDYILADAIDLNLEIPCRAIIKGDQKSASIAAASIIAKVTRDRYMVEIDKLYPQYGFKNHKGYVTQAHLEAIEKYGVCKIHRRSFAPIKRQLMKQLTLDL